MKAKITYQYPIFDPEKKEIKGLKTIEKTIEKATIPGLKEIKKSWEKTIIDIKTIFLAFKYYKETNPEEINLYFDSFCIDKAKKAFLIGNYLDRYKPEGKRKEEIEKEYIVFLGEKKPLLKVEIIN